MSWIDPRQWVLVLLFCAASVIGVNFWKGRLVEQGDRQGYQRAISEQTSRSLSESEARRKKEAELQAAKQKAEEQYESEKRRRMAAAAAAQSELGRLRIALEERGSRGGQAGGDSGAGAGADGGARLEQELLGQCAGTLAGMGQEADRLEAQVVGLQQYIRSVILTVNK